MDERILLYRVDIQKTGESSIAQFVVLNSELKQLPEEAQDKIVKLIEECSKEVYNIISDTL